MLNIQFTIIPLVSAFNIAPYTEGNTLGIITSGYYELLKSADDNFDTYNTGFNTGVRYFFSGSGYWNGSGYTVAPNSIYWFDTIDATTTGLYTGGFDLKFLTGNVLRSGYFENFTSTSGYVIEPQINYWFESFDIYPTGLYIYNIPTGALPTTNFTYGISGLNVGEFSSGIKINIAGTGFNRSGYLEFSGITTGFVSTGIAGNTLYTGSPNSGFASGHFQGLAYVSSSGFSGYGNAMIFTGFGDSLSSNIISHIATGSLVATTGTLEVRFKRFNAYAPVLSRGVGAQALSGLGNQPLIFNDPISNLGTTLSMTTGDSASVIPSGIGFGAIGTRSGVPPPHTITSSINIENNTWYMVSVSSEEIPGLNDDIGQQGAAAALLYIDGRINATGIVSGRQFLNIGNTNEVFRIGGQGQDLGHVQDPTGRFYGMIDEIRVWNYIRSSGQIYSGWNQKLSDPQESGLAIYLRI